MGLPGLRIWFDQNHNCLFSDVELSSLVRGNRVWRTRTGHRTVWPSHTGGTLECSRVLDDHIATCVQHALEGDNLSDREAKIDELIKVMRGKK